MEKRICYLFCQFFLEEMIRGVICPTKNLTTSALNKGLILASLKNSSETMVELLNDFPPHIAAYRASGKVNREEYEDVVVARVNEVAEKYGRINFIVRLETDFDNYSIGAFIDYLKVSFKHFTEWNRMAIVSDERWVRMLYDALSPLVPGVIKGFTLKQFQSAKEWVSQPLAEDK